jgi:hypothetical protein
MPLAPNLYNPLNQLLDASAIPGNFKPLEDAVQTVIDDLLKGVYYKDFIFRSYGNGEQRFYSIVLLTKRLQLPIFNVGMNLVFFHGTSTFSEFPVVMRWNWPVYHYIAGFGANGFAYTPEAFIGLLMELADIEDETEILTEIIEVFLGSGGQTYQAFIANLINRANAYSSGVPPGAVTEIQTIVAALGTIETAITDALTITNLYTLQSLLADYQNHPTIATAVTDLQTALTNLEENFEVNFNLFVELFGAVLDGFSNLEEKLENLAALFYGWLGDLEPADIYELLLPQFEIELSTLNIALEFPRNWLIPLVPDTQNPGAYIEDPDPAVRSALVFDAGSVKVSSKYGFEFEDQSNFTFTRSQIGQTGLTLEITSAQLDYSQHENSLPGADKYPANFKGVYVEEVVIGLPSFWNKDANNTVEIFGQNLLIGGYKNETTSNNHFTFDGTVGLRDTFNPSNATPALTTTLPGDLTLSLTRFDLTFLGGSITQSSLEGQLTIPTGNGQHVVLIIGQYKDNGFSLSAQGDGETPLLNIPLGNFGDLYLSELTIGSDNGAFFLSLKAGLSYETNFPFIDKILPNPLLLEKFKVSKNGIEEFALNISWDEIGENFVQAISGESEMVIPLGWNLFDVLFINALKLKTGLDINASTFSSKALIDGALVAGPLYIGVADVGAELEVEYVQDPNAPNAPTDAAYIGPLAITGAFIPPTKIGLTIDADKVKGGGAVWLDYENQRYSGALQISIEDTLSLAAIGIVAFKAPDGSKQFSFLAIVTAEFPPIHLAYGFWLMGAGGMLGLHRGMDPNVLRDGVKTGLLESILFPEDPVENFDKIVTGLDAAFPITQGQFVIGPMLQIGWGAQNEKTQLLRIDLGLIIELPRPVRIALPGVLQTLLPKANSDVITIKAAFIAILDFGAKLFSLDASIYDSHILNKFTLSGDMAMRLSWGRQPVFVLSVGGFHPEYTQVPKGLTKMSRITLSILDEPKAKVKLETYFAITSNSVQVGARADLRFAAGDKGHVQVLGYVYFDALFQFNPFMMIVEVGAGVSVEFKGTPILAIHLLFRLEGPSPWRVQGHATFAIIGIEFKVPFDKTFGERKITTVEETDLLPLIKEALEQPDAWRSLAPQRSSIHELVAIKATTGQEESLLLQPYGRLAVQQSIAPLDTTLEKYGERGLIGDQQYYTINNLYVVQNAAPVPLAKQVVEEEFARAQYEELSDQEKLGVPAFEQFPAGVQLSEEVLPVQVSDQEALTPTYEVLLIEAEDETSYVQNPMVPSEEEFQTLLGNHASATSSLSKAASTKETSIQLAVERFYVVAKANLQPYDPAHATVPDGFTRTRADEWLRQLRQTDSAAAALLQVVPASELVLIDTSTWDDPDPIDLVYTANRQQLMNTL